MAAAKKERIAAQKDKLEARKQAEAFMGVLVLIVGSVANIWLQLPAMMLTISVLAIAIFSAYILFDVQRIVNGGETNYVTATLAIYLDVYNIFTNLLAILGIFGGNRN